MRETRYVVSGVGQANTGQTTIVESPTWAKHALWYLSVVAASGTTPLTDFKFHPVIPKVTGAVAISTTQGGGGGNNEAQTVTLTGGPTDGWWTIRWTGVSANIDVTTPPISPKATAAVVQDALTRALHRPNQSTYKPGDIAVGRTGTGTSGDPYVYTLTWSGSSVANTNVDQVTVTGTRLYTYEADTALDFAGWDGITQIAGTTAGVVTIAISPYMATDDTGPVYAVTHFLPERIAAKVTLDRGSSDETYTYSLYVTFAG